MSEILTPGSPEWRKVMTASKVAAVLSLSPWQSPYSLWMEMAGRVEPAPGNDQTRRGQYLEPAILAWWRDQHHCAQVSVAWNGEWHEAWTGQQTFTRDGWAAATPDAVAFPDDLPETPVLVEAKSTAQEWDELPPYYLVQCIWQMWVSGINRVHVPVIGPRLTFTEYVVDLADYAEDVDLIVKRCRAFYDSLSADEPPPLDDSVATYDVVRRVHPDIERGESVELTHNQARSIVDWSDELKATEAAARLARSQTYDAMGRAQYATHNGVRIARRQASAHGVNLIVTAKPGDIQ